MPGRAHVGESGDDKPVKDKFCAQFHLRVALAGLEMAAYALEVSIRASIYSLRRAELDLAVKVFSRETARSLITEAR